MEIHRLDGGLSVAAQPLLSDLRVLYDAGFRAIVCNRPDGEGTGQPAFADSEHAAARFSMQARYLPVEPGSITPAHGAAFASLLAELPGPVLAYCRSGKRSACLWDLARAGGA